jgi:hypothetical protein
MRSCFPAFLFITILFGIQFASAQSPKKSSSGTAVSDREKAGLRGSVKSFESKTTFNYSDQSSTSTETNEYALDGRLLRQSIRYPQSAELLWVHSYDAQGRLTETTIGPAATPPSERTRTIYSYGEDGRVSAATQYPSNSTELSVRSDDQGRRVDIQRLPEIPNRADMGIAATMWLDSGLGLPTASGGTFETVYNDRGQPAEGHMLDKDSRILARVVRSFDSQGRPSRDQLTGEPNADSLPPEVADQLNLEQKKGLAAFMASQMMTGSLEYKYDSSGSLIEKRRRNGALGDEITTIAYNDHHDKVLERSATGQSPEFGTEYGMDKAGNMIPVKQSSAAPPTISEMRYEYVYDSNGNWTEQKVFRTPGNGADSKPESVIKRTITYY